MRANILATKMTVLVLWVSLPGVVVAGVQGVCSNCHVMHASRDGTSLTPRPSLLTTDCIGCHTGTNAQSGSVPYVYTASGVNYGATGTEGNTLAGGNFYWVGLGNDAQGHNVQGLANLDLTHGTLPPGGTDLGRQLSCAGTYGCHGDRSIVDETTAMAQTHHHDATGHITGGAAATAGESYRFLKGVGGYEDPEWEFTPSATLHNQYQGQARSDETQNDVTSISSLCGQCHGLFHNGAGSLEGRPPNFASPWLRHPTDFDMNAVKSKEFGAYGGSGVNSYQVTAPLASTDTSTVLGTVLTVSGDAVVMCLSCHRAHGTPNDSMLRWNYKAWPGTGGYPGCQVCHTAKN